MPSLLSVVVLDVSGAEQVRLDVDSTSSYIVLRKQIADSIGCLPSQFYVMLGGKTLSDHDTLAAACASDTDEGIIELTLVKFAANVCVGAFERFHADHLRVDRLERAGQTPSSVVTKIGVNAGVSYAAIASTIMEPDSGKWWWSYRILETACSIVMIGVCSTEADPKQDGLRFTRHGAAYECWNGLVYDLNDMMRRPRRTVCGVCGTNDLVTFCLDTDAGILDMYKNGVKLGTLMSDLRGRRLHAHVELEHPGDSVELLGETLPLE
eukprot:TRINITY_DN45359_c0_g1_i1.p1 TRINITY_DN45359_c0_g1~~TRINITY_DN45359_c0_g1_i1.p1  ORF type:complete len:266 (-),score=35.54 TRINITY_DN45359_c0_g1_i1:108-905(-)